MNSSLAVKIDLGCGDQKRKGHIGVDRVLTKHVDVVADLEFRLPFKDNVATEVYTSHTLEHLEKLQGVMEEIHSILKPDGICLVVVPHFSNPLAYSDYTHKRFFGLQSFDYFQRSQDQPRERPVPSFYSTFHFLVMSRRLVFYELHSRLGEIILNKVFNRSFKAQLFYEKHFAWIFPCREIKFELKKPNPSLDT
jgi:predicted SAM-dependent methyltransferase